MLHCQSFSCRYSQLTSADSAIDSFLVLSYFSSLASLYKCALSFVDESGFRLRMVCNRRVQQFLSKWSLSFVDESALCLSSQRSPRAQPPLSKFGFHLGRSLPRACPSSFGVRCGVPRSTRRVVRRVGLPIRSAENAKKGTLILTTIRFSFRSSETNTLRSHPPFSSPGETCSLKA